MAPWVVLSAVRSRQADTRFSAQLLYLFRVARLTWDYFDRTCTYTESHDIKTGSSFVHQCVRLWTTLRLKSSSGGHISTKGSTVNTH